MLSMRTWMQALNNVGTSEKQEVILILKKTKNVESSEARDKPNTSTLNIC